MTRRALTVCIAACGATAAAPATTARAQIAEGTVTADGTVTAEGAVIADPILEDPAPVYVPALRQPGRWLGGFDFGLGMLKAGCDGCGATAGGASVGVYAGVQLTRRVAVVVEGWTVAHLVDAETDVNGVLTHTLIFPAARVWITPTLWLHAGAGLALLGQTTTGADEYASSPAVVMALGRELRHQPTSGVDLSLRLGAGRYADSEDRAFLLYQLSATVGWHWN